MQTLIGRARECRALDELLGAVRDGEARVLVLRGEAGIGKTALLQHLVDAAQGFEVSRLAFEGLTNAEIGARLFVSVRTAEWHLRKVFTKLGISSRRELKRVLPRLGQPAIKSAR